MCGIAGLLLPGSSGETDRVAAAGQSVTVRMPVAHLINATAMRRFARFRARVLKQMGETIHADD